MPNGFSRPRSDSSPREKFMNFTGATAQRPPRQIPPPAGKDFGDYGNKPTPPPPPVSKLPAAAHEFRSFGGYGLDVSLIKNNSIKFLNGKHFNRWYVLIALFAFAAGHIAVHLAGVFPSFVPPFVITSLIISAASSISGTLLNAILGPKQAKQLNSPNC